MPSMHSAYPTLCLMFSLDMGSNIMRFLFLLCSFGIWTAAVYTGHHYIVDVIAGIICSITVYICSEYILIFRCSRHYLNRATSLISWNTGSSKIASSIVQSKQIHKPMMPQPAMPLLHNERISEYCIKIDHEPDQDPRYSILRI
ncbi:hypothetical protein GJ496_008673 [Pomphorhynchus laevis]|nr:hypothetical protein GJ496_008673 [Pomphorhynchus laevis]